MISDGQLTSADDRLDRIVGRLIAAHPDRSGVLEGFARAYLRWVTAEYVAAHSAEDVAAQIASIFRFADERGRDELAVRVFNPEPSTDGYSLPVCVVEISAPDMAFLVDSVTNEIQGQGYACSRVFHPVMGVERDAAGAITGITPARNALNRESVQHHELDRALHPEAVAELQQSVLGVLHDVRRAVVDFEPMQGAIYRMIKVAKDGVARYSKADVDESVAFLEWLLDANFVFLGYREYRISTEDDTPMLSVVPGSGLGVLHDDDQSRFAKPVPLTQLRPDLRARYETGGLLVITKTNSLSRVHRRLKMDYIGVRHIGRDGSVVGEARLIGLFTSKAYMTSAGTIPVLHGKLQRIIESEDLIEGSHTFKEVVQVFDSFPKDELFATPTEDIRASIVGLIQAQEREQVRIFVRRDQLQRNVSVLVVMGRDRFNASLRRKLQDLLMERFDGESIDYRLALGETDTARLHFTIWTRTGRAGEVSFKELEAEVLALAQTWEEHLADALVDRYGPEVGRALLEEWGGRFPDYYKDSVELELAAGDVGKLDELVRQLNGAPVVGLQNERSDGAGLTRLAVYRSTGKLELSAIMPTLEALGLRVVEEVPTRLEGGSGDIVIHDFGVTDRAGSPLELGAVAERVAATVVAVLEGTAESDSLNQLIVVAELDHAQVAILRAYRTYWRRVGPAFSVEYVNATFVAHPGIARDLVALFSARFDPDSTADEAEIAADILNALDQVQSLEEDRILRGFLGLVLATVRTNAFAPDTRSLAFKLRSSEVPAMPQPSPLFEIYVYSSEVEGIHLRGGPVARGGIRWSTRREDYRAEVLGLMKAQMTKNAVIVPTGSKGGFVLRRPPTDPALLRDAVRDGYVIFIRGLLDLTDNLVDGTVVHPPGVRTHDAGDPYLVVAADKGTATFSDIANGLSTEYGFWLGDAFASGGSAGYDHKELGITARGAWESVKWHFQELGVDVMSQPFSVVGIGDMSGDVFGNGMLRSPYIELIAAFDHRHVFIDPHPDLAASFAERQRMFALPRSSWDDYDRTLLSPGGGVYRRSAKRIELSDEARARLGIEERHLTPDEVIRTIVRAPVDLLWNGGIGTYVKATDEPNEAVGDRGNDALRADASELRCRVVGEGGNLGFTQRARIEFARAGGRIFTDFIDNAGGVHCSDREVNLKILLGLAEARGELDRAGRDALVEEVVGDVVEAILYENFLQAQILAQEADASVQRLEAYEDLMTLLESEHLLDRRIEGLLTSDEMSERARTGHGLTAPELAVLLAYAKRALRDWLLDSDLPDSDDVFPDVLGYFPPLVVERFGHLVADHPLRRELAATIVANGVVNSEGVTFATRLMTEIGAAPAQVVRAYRVATAVTDAHERWAAIESLTGKVPLDVARSLLRGVDGLVEAVTRWHLAHPSPRSVADIVEETHAGFRELTETIADIGPPQWRATRQAAVASWVDRGVPADVAARHVYQEELVHAPDIIEVGMATGQSVHDVARVFFLAGPAFEIDWLEEHVDGLPAATRWHRRAIQTVQDDMVLVRRQLAEAILASAPDASPEHALDRFLLTRTHAVGRLARFMRALVVDGVDDVAPVIVAIRQIRSVVTSSE